MHGRKAPATDSGTTTARGEAAESGVRRMTREMPSGELTMLLGTRTRWTPSLTLCDWKPEIEDVIA